jgi:hypothetical protein
VHPDAAADPVGRAGQSELRVEQGQHLLPDLDQCGQVRHVDADDGELVATEASHGVAGPGRGAQPVGDLDEKFVTGGVPRVVVDRLEAIEVDEKDADRSV